MTRNQMLRRYLEYGFTLLPVKKGEKRPALANWKEYQSRKPTNDELRSWFKDPEVGVGLVTGAQSGVIVVDEDSYKAAGKDLDLQTPLVVQTGSGGKHYYFKYQPGVGNSVNRDDAVDIRGEGGFVVLPPTTHPNGQNYEWIHVLPDNLLNLPALDEALAEQLATKTKDGVALKISDYVSIDSGSRNDSLHRVACSLLNKYKPDEAFLLLSAINNTYSPPLGAYELKTLFESSMKFVLQHPKDENPATKPTTKELLEIIGYDGADSLYKDLMTRYGEGVTTGYAALDEFFRFIPQQLYILSASTHVGKTTLALNMAGRCAKAGYQVIFASLEQGVFVLPRLRSMFGNEEGLRENLSFIVPNHLPKPSDFVDLLKGNPAKPKLLIIDHLHYFERGNRGATEEMDRLVVAMQGIAKDLEIPVLVIAHVRKINDDKAPTMDDLKDSSSLSQIPAVVAMMHRDKSSDMVIAAGGRIYADTGTVYIYKNRIFGKTGTEKFTIHDTGEIVFDRTPLDKVNQQSEIVGLEGLDW